MVLILILLALATSYCWYRGIKASKSGSFIGGFMSPKRAEDKNVPLYKTFPGVCAIILTVVDIAVVWAMLAAR